MWTSIVLLLSACAPVGQNLSDSPAGSTGLSYKNTVCDHQFSNSQLASAPEFVEIENNTIVTGRTSEDLFAALATAPNNGGGATVWNLKWQFDSRYGPRGCRISDLETRVAITYQLPLWPDRLLAIDQQFADQWNDYSDALRAHHCMHGKTGIDASIEVKESLRRMAPRSTCEQLKVDADELARSIISKYKDVESRFTPPSAEEYFSR